MNIVEENTALRRALEQYANLQNWGYYDGSNCRKGIGLATEACFIGPRVAQEALAEIEKQRAERIALIAEVVRGAEQDGRSEDMWGLL